MWPNTSEESPTRGSTERGTPRSESISSLHASVCRSNSKVRLAFEKSCLGFYVSGHPLDRYEQDMKLRERFEGTVAIKFAIDPRGSVSEALVAKNSTGSHPVGPRGSPADGSSRAL